MKNLKWGVDEGYFRKELNPEIMAVMRLEQVDMIFNQIVFPPGKYMISEVMTEITEHYLYGLCTLKGHKLINKYKQRRIKIEYAIYNSIHTYNSKFDNCESTG
jgi:hypothetical protein